MLKYEEQEEMKKEIFPEKEGDGRKEEDRKKVEEVEFEEVEGEE